MAPTGRAVSSSFSSKTMCISNIKCCVERACLKASESESPSPPPLRRFTHFRGRSSLSLRSIACAAYRAALPGVNGRRRILTSNLVAG